MIKSISMAYRSPSGTTPQEHRRRERLRRCLEAVTAQNSLLPRERDMVEILSARRPLDLLPAPAAQGAHYGTVTLRKLGERPELVGAA
jgi:hypothetical protein